MADIFFNVIETNIDDDEMWAFNPLVTNGLSHLYHLDESTFILEPSGVNFHFNSFLDKKIT